MTIETTEVLVVGAGQAGVAMSEHLSRADVPHLVLERGRIAERWRSERWDSLVANGPAWHDRFPGREFTATSSTGFAPKEEVAAYFEEYAEQFEAPIRTGVAVTSVRRLAGRPGFRAETSDGVIEAQAIVAATGPFQVPVIPTVVPEDIGVTQLHSNAYKNPDALPEGGVLVVGAGSSGVQIADEINRSGRRVVLSVGPHDRPPRTYRGRDNVWWLGVLGKWDLATPPQGADHVTIAVSGARGGRTVDFRELAADGITLVGRTLEHTGGRMTFAPNLAEVITAGDENYLSVLREADAYIAAHGLDLPPEPEAHELGPLPPEANDPILELDLAAEGISTIVWATGFTSDYSWLEVDAFDDRGRPAHSRGVSTEPGVYFLGLPWQSRRGSSFIWGVWHDARFLGDQIAIQRGYRTYAFGDVHDSPAEPHRPAAHDTAELSARTSS